MKAYELGDHPLSDPHDDLLGAIPQAQTLAEFLEDARLPFTLGLYGAWGDGKTTFARFLVHYLQNRPQWNDVRFVEFSAWPYVTADAIWRALLERLAREVYRVTPDPPEDEDTPVGLVAKLRHFLHSDVITPRTAAPTAAKARYERLMGRIDRSAVVATRSAVELAAGRNLSALAGVALDATGSPGVAALKQLLGLADNWKRPEEQARNVAESVEEIRRDLRDLFVYLGDTRIVVLLDDLDRCLPEVALDVLETIKVFLFESAESNCLFVVAADEELIGRGLRARLGDASNTQARLYMEKVVQLGVTVPRVEVGHATRLTAARSPEWALAADIIATGVGTNPRRLKQQCNVLSYRYLAAAKAHTP